MDDRRIALGRRGEQAACEHLLAAGYRILERNARLRRGELDIVARAPDGTICFVEVKTDRSGNAGDAGEWIGGRKQHRIQRLAQEWAQRRCDREVAMRFDAVLVRVDASDAIVGIRHIPGAFLPDASGYF